MDRQSITRDRAIAFQQTQVKLSQPSSGRDPYAYIIKLRRPRALLIPNKPLWAKFIQGCTNTPPLYPSTTVPLFPCNRP